MATEKQLEVAKQYFESNPSEAVVHISTDGQVFFQKNYNDAYNHQRRLNPEHKLTSVYRKELDRKPEGAGLDAPEAPNEKWTKEKISEWLGNSKVETTGKETKAILLELVQKHLADASSNGSADDGNESDDND